MSGKRERDYRAVFAKVKALYTLNVERFVLDFERAAWAAIKDLWPGVQIKGCLFHYTQVCHVFIV